jgi:hypothetical protein
VDDFIGAVVMLMASYRRSRTSGTRKIRDEHTRSGEAAALNADYSFSAEGSSRELN